MQRSDQLGRGFAWVAVASGIAGVLDLVSTLAVLWLWVSPGDLGIATLAAAVFPVIERLATLGLGAAAVRGEGDRRTLSSVFWLGLASAVTVLALALLGRRAIGAAFDEPIVGSLVCAYAAKLVVQTTYAVPEAVLRRELRFRELSLIRIASLVVEAIAKIVAAWAGAHVWCFAIGPIAATFVTAVGIQLRRWWWPALVFEARAALAALRFGVQVSASELLYYAYSSMDYVVIGRVFGDAAVGAYRLAYEMVLDVVRLVSLITAEVAFPAFAKLGGDRAAAGELLVRFTRRNVLLVAPVLVVIAVAADDLLAILYPPLGPEAALAARILCVVGALRAVSFVLPAMLAGLGHARDALIYNAVAAIALPIAFVIGATIGSTYVSVAWAWAAGYPIAFGVLVVFVVKRTGVPLTSYARQLAPVVLCAVIAVAAAIAARNVLPEGHLVRAAGIAAATLGAYAAALYKRGFAIASSSRR